MIAVVSPAKKLNTKAVFPENLPFTEPLFKAKAAYLADYLRKLSPAELQSLMHISDRLARTNYERFQQWEEQGSVPAVFLYNGDTYRGLDIASFPPDKLADLQDHVRIISGLYGLLRPLDLINPYRLEMKTPLKTAVAGDLYEFWRDDVTDALREQLQGQPLVNLASKEYAQVIDKERLDAPFIQVDFKDLHNGRYKTMGLYAKRARGNMARWIALNKPEKPEDLKAFDGLGYRFNPEMSSENHLVFTRG